MERIRSNRGAAIAAVILGLAVGSPSTGLSQGILNTERYQLESVTGTHANVDFSISGSAGNARLLNASASGIVGVRGDRHWVRLIGGGRYLADSERSVVDDRFVQLRHSLFATPGLELYQFAQYQANQTLLLESRWLLGGGVRTPIVSSERMALVVGTGAMLEVEDRDRSRIAESDDPRLRTVRLANQLVLTRRLAGGAKIQNIVYAQPALTRWSDLRLLNDLLLAAPLSDAVSLTLSLEWRHDSRPPARLKRNDLSFSTGISIDLR